MGAVAPATTADVFTIMLVERHALSAAGSARALRLGPWVDYDEQCSLPDGERLVRTQHAGGSVRHIALIRSDRSQLEKSLELGRYSDAVTVVDFSGRDAAVGVMNRFEWAGRAQGTTRRGWRSGRRWETLAPATIAAGACGLRVTGWFDDREAGIDVFAPLEMVLALAGPVGGVSPRGG